MKPCKRCNGTGRVLEKQKNTDKSTFWWWRKSYGVKGKICPSCHGKGVK